MGRVFLVILDHFLPFDPRNNPRNQNFEKNEKKFPEVLSFYTCVPSNEMMYGS